MALLRTVIRYDRDGNFQQVYLGTDRTAADAALRDFPPGTRFNELHQLSQPMPRKYAPPLPEAQAETQDDKTQDSRPEPEPVESAPVAEPTDTDELPDFPTPASPARLGKPAKK
jgi:hypothetical protein